MAGSRLEKIGTIYTRTSGLIKSRALNWEDRPLWYDIYEAFPPKEEPSFDRPAPKIPLRKIFYEEDKIRALFHKHNKQIGAINWFDSKHKTLTQRFIDNYKKIEVQYGESVSEEKLYQEAIELLRVDRETRKADEEEISLSTAFKEAQAKSPSVNVKVKDIFD